MFPDLEGMFEGDVQGCRRLDRIAVLNAEEVRAILDMLRAMLVLRPEGRVTAQELL